MIHFEFEPISSFPDPHVLLGMAEFLALAQGAFALSDLVTDSDELITWYIERAPLAEHEGLREEPQHALQLAREEIETSIRECALSANEVLQGRYPFVIGPEPGIILEAKPRGEIDVYGWCYLALQLFAIEKAGMATFGADPEDRVRNARDHVRRAFFALFEVIAGLAAANEVGGIPVFLSESRSTQTLLKRLAFACRLFGRGRAKTMAQLTHPVERDANDGGIDVVVGHFGPEGRLTHTALVGATVQEQQQRGKVINRTVVERFLRYLVNDADWRPVHAYLVHPEPFDDGLRYRCAEGDCLYIYRDLILEHMHPIAGNIRMAPSANRTVRAHARSKLAPFSAIEIQIEFDRHPIFLPPHAA